jgi:hypothetical protein
MCIPPAWSRRSMQLLHGLQMLQKETDEPQAQMSWLLKIESMQEGYLSNNERRGAKVSCQGRNPEDGAGRGCRGSTPAAGLKFPTFQNACRLQRCLSQTFSSNHFVHSRGRCHGRLSFPNAIADEPSSVAEMLPRFVLLHSIMLWHPAVCYHNNFTP